MLAIINMSKNSIAFVTEDKLETYNLKTSRKYKIKAIPRAIILKIELND